MADSWSEYIPSIVAAEPGRRPRRGWHGKRAGMTPSF